MSAPQTRSLADLLWLLVGPVVWFLHLVVLYGAEALICTPPVGSGRAMMWMGAAATIATLGALAMLAAVSIRRVQDAPEEQTDATFLRKTTLLLALLSAIGVIWSALPLALVPVCASAGG
ncbi:hypothetical protein [Bradyrhizobium sp. AUGA SZCCT0160]|uniref:hypothetical protein n=1 Tax=Bradyrhizobium sp. AUGA SZCCT0160 TaxID=2807662 RepID=UPI001BA948AE|nr:hypothetical protein [Bradyrhizobium sp. AUGA SZCCT0160]MBR1189450.1 hypothetical protein [Bradyrhizobium sp. AUGA SZCCT0160]